MKIPVKLLADRVDKNRVLGLGKLIHPLGPKRNGKPHEQDGLDEDDGKFQVRGDATLDAFVIGDGMFPFAETHKDINEEDRPTEKERAHEPVAELDDVIDLVAVLRSIRRHADELVDQGEATHIYPGLRRSIPGAARAAYSRAPRYENQTHPLPP